MINQLLAWVYRHIPFSVSVTAFIVALLPTLMSVRWSMVWIWWQVRTQQIEGLVPFFNLVSDEEIALFRENGAYEVAERVCSWFLLSGALFALLVFILTSGWYLFIYVRGYIEKLDTELERLEARCYQATQIYHSLYHEHQKLSLKTSSAGESIDAMRREIEELVIPLQDEREARVQDILPLHRPPPKELPAKNTATPAPDQIIDW